MAQSVIIQDTYFGPVQAAKYVDNSTTPTVTVVALDFFQKGLTEEDVVRLTQEVHDEEGIPSS